MASGDPLDKAGAYAIQNASFHPVSRLRGCYASVMGLPLCELVRMLGEIGVHAPASARTACLDAFEGPRPPNTAGDRDAWCCCDEPAAAGEEPV